MLKVLIGDDDRDDIDIFHEALCEVNPHAELARATNGVEVLDVLKTWRPQIIFLDINMPEMDGWECLRVLKSKEIYKDIPVVIFSTSSSMRDLTTAIEAGALCFFTKPDRYSELKMFLDEMTAAVLRGKPESLKQSPYVKRMDPT